MKPAVVIIGGGVIGLSTAYHLALRGQHRIIVVEKDRVGEGSSRRAAGITTGLLWTETGIRARKLGLQRFREISRELEDYTYHNEHGCLNLFSPQRWPDRAALLPLYDRLQAPYAILSSPEIRRRWPELNPPTDYVGLHDPGGGYSEPIEYLAALTRALCRMNVEIREETTPAKLLLQSGQVAGVETDREKISADLVIATVHAWTLPFLAPLGIRLPVKHFIHQRYLSAPRIKPLEIPPVNADDYGGYLRPATGQRILMGVETPKAIERKVTSTGFRMEELSAPADLREQAVKRFLPFLPALAQCGWESTEVGLISFSADGEPIIGRIDPIPGLLVGLAFHSGGFSYNTVAGLLLAELAGEGKTSIDISAFSPGRFDPHTVEGHLATTVAQEAAVRRRH